MCGIAAVMGEPGPHLLEVFEVLLSANVGRGKDSSGVAAIGKKTNLVKGCFLPLELMRQEFYAEKVTSQVDQTFCYIGHTRAATIGTVKPRNAHPFRYKNIILVHNGTLTTDISTKLKRHMDTDSETICVGIAEMGIEEVWKELIGASCVVYYDTTAHTLNFATNGRRPLHFALSKGRKDIYIASETWMLHHISATAQIPFQKKTVWEPFANHLWSFRYEPGHDTLIEESRILESWFTPAVSRPYGEVNPIGTHGHVHDDWIRNQRGRNHGSAVMDGTNSKNPRIYEEMTEGEFKTRYDECCFCAADITQEFSTTFIIDRETAVCADCAATAALSGRDITNELMFGN